jgi:nucleoside-diphosphate-sugar epimerase
MFIVTGTHLPLGGAIATHLERNGHEVRRVNRAVSLGHPSDPLSNASGIINADIELHATRHRTAVDCNILGTRAVRRCARQLNIPVIQLSSIVAQGPSTVQQPHISTAPMAPHGVIARSLGIAEQLLIKSRVDADVFRLAVPYGFDGSFDCVCNGLRRSRVRPLLARVHLSFIHIQDLVRTIECRLEHREEPAFFGHLSDGVTRTGEDLLNALERSGNSAIRLPFALPKRIWQIADRLASPFGNWDMMTHLGHGAAWTSLPTEADTAFGFCPTMSWSKHLRDMNLQGGD